MAATSQQIMTDLEGLSARGPLAVIGYVTALQTMGYITTPSAILVHDPMLNEPKARAPRNKGMSKTAQAITAVFVAEGMSKRDIVKKTNLTPAQVSTALPTMMKNGYAYIKNSRWFAGPAPAKSAAGRPPGTAKTTPTSTKNTDISLSDATLKAVQANRDGITANNVLDYISREFGMTVRSNHLGIALQRHRRAGRLETRDDKWYMPTVEELRQAG